MYHLIHIHNGNEWKMAFKTPLGHFGYQVMPSGLTNSPAVFQAVVNDVLWDILNTFLYFNLDNILNFQRWRKKTCSMFDWF